MKKLFALLALVTLLVSLIPGVALAGGGVPAGLTILYWDISPNQGGKQTGIHFDYSGGFSTDLFLSIPFDSSWNKIDPIDPILEAYKEGYGPNLGGSGGIIGITINFAPNVLAAMKVQNFNPSQVGGANIPPSSTTLTASETAWLKTPGIGYSGDLANITTSTSTPTTTPTPAPTPTTQSQPKPSPQKATSTQTNTTTPTQQSKAKTPSPTVQSDPTVGKTVKTPSGPITPEMAAANQKLASQNPPSLNPANIPIKVPTKKETSATRNVWIWIVAGGIGLVLLAAAGRVVYVRHRTI